MNGSTDNILRSVYLCLFVYSNLEDQNKNPEEPGQQRSQVLFVYSEPQPLFNCADSLLQQFMWLTSRRTIKSVVIVGAGHDIVFNFFMQQCLIKLYGNISELDSIMIIIILIIITGVVIQLHEMCPIHPSWLLSFSPFNYFYLCSTCS